MINYYKDFSKGERDYLKGQEMTEDRFNKLDDTSRREWKEECKTMSLESNWTRHIVKGGFKVFSKNESQFAIEWKRELAEWDDKLRNMQKIFFWKKREIYCRSINEYREEVERLIPLYKQFKKFKQQSFKPFLLKISVKLAEMAQ